MKKQRSYIQLLLILLFGILYLWELHTIYRFNPYPCEDAYITFRYSQNFAEGAGPVFNDGEYVEGYSNFLWMSTLALVHWAGLDMVRFSQIIGILFNTLALLLVWYIPRRHFGAKGSAAFLAPLLYLLFLPFHFSAASGLETSFYIFLVLLCLHTVLWAGRRKRPFCVAALLFLLIALTRPEGIIFFVFLGGWLLWCFVYRRETLAPYVPGVIVFLTCYSAFVLWRFSYYGLLLPNTYYAKGAFPFMVRTALGFAVNKSFVLHYSYLFVFILTLIGFVKLKTEKKIIVLLTFITAGFFFSIGFSGFDWMPFYRYTLPVVPLIIIFCQVLFVKIWPQLITSTGVKKYAWNGFFAFLLFLAAEQFVADMMFALRWNQISNFAYHNQKFLGDWIKREIGPQSVIAAGDVGRFAYFSEARIIDIFGLTSREFAQLKKKYCVPDIDLTNFSINFDSYKNHELGLLLNFKPDYVFLYKARLKISDTFPGSAFGIAGQHDFNQNYDYMTTVTIIPSLTSNSWPRLHHFIDVLDLSAGLLSWIRDGWGYDIYIRKDSPAPRFAFEFYPDERIKRIVAVSPPENFRKFCFNQKRK